MKKVILMGTLLVFSTTLDASEAATHPHWAMDGAGCVPIHSAIQQDLYVITGGRIKFKQGKTGSITVMCPVSVIVKSANKIDVSYRDSTGRSANASVKVALRRIRKHDGAVNTVSELVFNSDSSGETSYTFDGTSTDPDHTFDHFKYYYYVQAALVRKSSKDIVEFGGVELDTIVR